MARQKVVIVGGGFAGVKTALELANNKQFDVTLITPRSRFEYHGAMYRSATGRSPLEVVLPMSEIFADALNVRVELDSVAELRPQTKEIEGESGRSYSYDILVLSLGYVVNYFDIHGMALYAESMYSITEAIKLRHRLVGAFRSCVKHNTELQISVIGGGPTGVEIASDLQNFASVVGTRHNLGDVKVHVRLIEAGERVLAGLKPESSKIAQSRLAEIGVDVRLHSAVSKCTKQTITVNGESLHSDITIWTAGNKANPLYGSYPDLFTLNERGRVQVSEYFNANSPNIFVIGDAADTPYSGMAQTAIHNAIALASNLKRAAAGSAQMAYEPLRPDYVVPIGGEWALLESGDKIVSGSEGWKARRAADKWVLQNFLVYDLANKHWQQGEKLAAF